MSLLSLAVQSLPGVSFLRLVRIFRVLRIFARHRSLRIIVGSLTAAVRKPPLCLGRLGGRWVLDPDIDRKRAKI